MLHNRHNLSLIAMSRTGHRAVMAWLGGAQNVEAKSFKDSMAMCEGLPILLLRDFPNWFASMRSWFNCDSVDYFKPHIDKWMTHVEAAHSIPTILFHEWVLAGHGDGIDAAKVSNQFGVTNFEGGSPLIRGATMAAAPAEFPVYQRVMDERRDAVELSAHIFGDVYAKAVYAHAS